MRRFSTLAFRVITIIVTLQLTLAVPIEPLKFSPGPPLYSNNLAMSVARIGYSAGRVGVPGLTSSPPLQAQTSAIQNIITAVDSAISTYGASSVGIALALQQIRQDAIAISSAISDARRLSSKVKDALTHSSLRTKLKPNEAREKLSREFSHAILSIENVAAAHRWPVSGTSSKSPLDQPLYQPLHVAYLADFMLHAGRATSLLQMQWKDISDMWAHVVIETREMNRIIELLENPRVCYLDGFLNAPKTLKEVVLMFSSVHSSNTLIKDHIDKKSFIRSRPSPPSSISSSYQLIENHIKSLLAPGSALPGPPAVGVVI